MTVHGSLLGVAAGLGASVAWSFANVFIQRAARQAGSVLPVLWGQLLGGALLGLAGPFFPPPGGGIDPLWLGAGSLASAVAYLAMFRAFGGGPVSVVSPVISSWALVSGGLGVLLFDEALPVGRVLGALLVVGGVMGIAARSRERAEWRAPRARVLGAAAASALGFGVMVASLRPLSDQLGPVLTIIALWTGQWVVAGPFVLRRPLLPVRAAWPAIGALGILEALGFLSLEAGVRVAPITVVAPASSLSVLFTVLLGRVWLREAVGWDRALLALVIVAGIATLGSA